MTTKDTLKVSIELCAADTSHSQDGRSQRCKRNDSESLDTHSGSLHKACKYACANRNGFNSSDSQHAELWNGPSRHSTVSTYGLSISSIWKARKSIVLDVSSVSRSCRRRGNSRQDKHYDCQVPRLPSGEQVGKASRRQLIGQGIANGDCLPPWVSEQKFETLVHLRSLPDETVHDPYDRAQA